MQCWLNFEKLFEHMAHNSVIPLLRDCYANLVIESLLDSNVAFTLQNTSKERKCIFPNITQDIVLSLFSVLTIDFYLKHQYIFQLYLLI